MANSWNGPQLGSPIRTDVPELQKKLIALLKGDPTSVADIPSGAKRLVNTSGVQWQVQQYNGSSWAAIGKLMHDVDKLDGYHAAITPAASTIAVRNADKKLEGDITGNAATASSAATLSETLPVNKGGTGATTSAAARTNLGVPPTSHASSGTAYGLATDTNYGHARSDGTTTNIVAGEVVVKDVAIGGDVSNLASKRGQIGDIQRITVKYPNLSDFNDVKDSGKYFCMTANMSAANAPSALGGTLKVIAYTGGNYVKQIFYIYRTNGVLQRFYNGDNTTTPWSPWRAIITEDSLATTSTPGIIKPDTVNGTTAVDSNGRLYTVKAPYVIAYQVNTDNKTYKDLCESYRYAYGASGNSRTAVLRAEATDTYNDVSIFTTFFNGDKVNKLGASLHAKSYSDGTSKIEANCNLHIIGGNRIVVADNTLKTGDLVVSMDSSRNGCLLCNGSAVSRITYANLFALLGTTFGEGDGSTTFNLPDFRDKTLWGANGNLMSILAAGLPNITGGLSIGALTADDSGAIRAQSSGVKRSTTDAGDSSGFNFDASRSSSIYGKSTTVQPPAIAVNIFIKY